MSKVSRRSVMRAFGEYLDCCSFLAAIKRGEAEGDVSKVARYSVYLNNIYTKKMESYLGYEEGEGE